MCGLRRISDLGVVLVPRRNHLESHRNGEAHRPRVDGAQRLLIGLIKFMGWIDEVMYDYVVVMINVLRSSGSFRQG